MTRIQKPPKPKLTEAALFGLLKAKLCQAPGGGTQNGGSAALLAQVRSASGFDSARTIDALAMGLWPSRGLWLHAYEIKCSRSDWVRELREPEKAEVFASKVDFFSLVVADRDIVQPGELPPNWGLLAPHGKGLKVHVEADALRDLSVRPAPLPPGFDRSFLGAVLRNATYVGEADPEAVVRAREEARVEAEASSKYRLERAEHDLQDLRAMVTEFEKGLGASIRGYSWHSDPRTVGAALRTALSGDQNAKRLEDRVTAIRQQAQALVDAADMQLADIRGETHPEERLV